MVEWSYLHFFKLHICIFLCLILAFSRVCLLNVYLTPRTREGGFESLSMHSDLRTQFPSTPSRGQCLSETCCPNPPAFLGCRIHAWQSVCLPVTTYLSGLSSTLPVLYLPARIVMHNSPSVSVCLSLWVSPFLVTDCLNACLLLCSCLAAQVSGFALLFHPSLSLSCCLKRLAAAYCCAGSLSVSDCLSSSLSDCLALFISIFCLVECLALCLSV